MPAPEWSFGTCFSYNFSCRWRSPHCLCRSSVQRRHASLQTCGRLSFVLLGSVGCATARPFARILAGAGMLGVWRSLVWAAFPLS